MWNLVCHRVLRELFVCVWNLVCHRVLRELFVCVWNLVCHRVLRELFEPDRRGEKITFCGA